MSDDKRKALMEAIERLDRNLTLNGVMRRQVPSAIVSQADLARLLAFARRVSGEPSEGMRQEFTFDRSISEIFKAMVARAIEEA